MITVTFNEDREKNTLTLDVNGHAGSDVKGKDLVCAASTAYLYEFIFSMLNAYRNDQLKGEPVMEIESGNAHVEVICKPKYYDTALTILYAVQMGYAYLECGNKEFVKVNRFDTEKSVENK